MGIKTKLTSQEQRIFQVARVRMYSTKTQNIYTRNKVLGEIERGFQVSEGTIEKLFDDFCTKSLEQYAFSAHLAYMEKKDPVPIPYKDGVNGVNIRFKKKVQKPKVPKKTQPTKSLEKKVDEVKDTRKPLLPKKKGLDSVLSIETIYGSVHLTQTAVDGYDSGYDGATDLLHEKDSQQHLVDEIETIIEKDELAASLQLIRKQRVQSDDLWVTLDQAFITEIKVKI